MDVALGRLFIVKTADEQEIFSKCIERLQHFAQFHLFTAALGPPFVFVETVAGKQDRHSYRRSTVAIFR